MKEPQKKRKLKMKRGSLQSIFSERLSVDIPSPALRAETFGQSDLVLDGLSHESLAELVPNRSDSSPPKLRETAVEGQLTQSSRAPPILESKQNASASDQLAQSLRASPVLENGQCQNTSASSTGQKDQPEEHVYEQKSLKDLVHNKITTPAKMTALKGVPDFLDFDRVWSLSEAIFSEPREGRKFSLACTIYSISDINDVMQTFRAKYRLLCNVAITREDVERHMATGCDRVHWAPEFVPFVRPFNAIEEIRKDVVEGTQGQQYSVQVLQKYWAAHFELDCETVFQVPFNVRRCPYDVQELNMTFQVENTRQDFNLPRYWGEWFWEPPYTASRWAITNMPQGDYMLDRKAIYLKRIPKAGHREMDQFKIVILARRNWRFFFWRVMFVLFVINAVTGMCFLFDNFDEMLSFVATMLVANVAFSLSIAEMIPHVSYLTYLDFYVYGSYIFMVSVVAELCFEKVMLYYSYFSAQLAADFRWAMWWMNGALLTLANIIWILISRRAYGLEQQRYESLMSEDVVHQKRMSWSKAQTHSAEKSALISKKE